MAAQLGLTDATLYESHIKPAANFVAAHGPRSASSAGRSSRATRPRRSRPRSPACSPRPTWPTLIRTPFRRASGAAWLTSTSARSRAGQSRPTGRRPTPYFIRLSKTGDPNAAISYNVGNGGPTLDQRNVIDAGFLELARLGSCAHRC